MLESVFSQAEMGMPESTPEVGAYHDESDKLYVGREFSTVEDFARWFAVQGLGAAPYNAVGYHHTFRPNASQWAGLGTVTGIYNFYHDELGWRPWGLGPHLWVYDGNGPWRSGTPHIYVGTHPAHDGAGIVGRNERWLHIEHAHDGDAAPFPPAMKRVSGELLAVVCSRHPHAQREIPLQFIRDSGIDNPGQPLGVMYHRDQNPDWQPGDWPKSCPGLQVSHENLDPDLIAFARARSPWLWSGVDDSEDPVSESGTLLAVDGATARREPSRHGAFMREIAAGQPVTTSGYTDRGEEVAGSARWYRLGEDNSWVHSSGGTYSTTL
ncbi:MAG: hypothetical protein K0S99_1529 [Thermomicrobiales bacterium]|nr:hypothetical protein [Thermomicrobiales bacterium]